MHQHQGENQLEFLGWQKPTHEDNSELTLPRMKLNSNSRSKVNTKITRILLHTVLPQATRNVPGMETPAPPPMVRPFRIATYMEIIDYTIQDFNTHHRLHKWT